MYMCMCMCVYVCRYMYRYMYMYMYVYMHICVYIYIYMHICICMHTYIHTYVRTYVRAYVHMYVRTCIHAYIHTYIHAYIHYITLHYIALHHITLPYLTLSYLILHYITSRYITCVYIYIHSVYIYIYIYTHTCLSRGVAKAPQAPALDSGAELPKSAAAPPLLKADLKGVDDDWWLGTSCRIAPQRHSLDVDLYEWVRRHGRAAQLSGETLCLVEDAICWGVCYSTWLAVQAMLESQVCGKAGVKLDNWHNNSVSVSNITYVHVCCLGS